MRTIRRAIRRIRKTENQPHPLPQDRASFEIPEKYINLPSGERFLAYDSGVGDANRMLIFATDRGLNVLNNADHWFMDGTFKTAPGLFYQL